MVGDIQFKAGDIIFRAGDPADTAYLVETGEVEIWIEREGAPHPVAVIGPEGLLGEMAVLDGAARSANASALTDVNLLSISRKTFEDRLADADPILKLLTRVVLDRLRRMLKMPGVKSMASSDHSQAVKSLRLEGELSAAIRNRELELHYQPIIDLKSAELAGYESLVRWRHKSMVLIPPGEFIPIAEASGIVTELTRWAITTSAEAIQALNARRMARDPHASAMFISVNISGRDLLVEGFADWLAAEVARIGVPPSLFKLEVTESMMMRDAEKSIAALESLKASGFPISIDDFGTGYSSLSYLARLPVATVKIDRSFVSSLDQDAMKARMVKTILALAGNLGLTTVAEGIETPAEQKLLTDLGTTFGQGYRFSRPLPFDRASLFQDDWTPSDWRV